MPKSKAKSSAAARAKAAPSEPQPTLASELAAVERDAIEQDDASIHTDDDSDFQDAADGTVTPSPSEPEALPEASTADANADAAAATEEQKEEEDKELNSRPAQASSRASAEVAADDARTPMPTATEFPIPATAATGRVDSTIPTDEVADITEASGKARSAEALAQQEGQSASDAPAPSSPATATPGSTQSTIDKGVAALRSRFGSGVATRSSSSSGGPPTQVPARTTSRPGSEEQANEGWSLGDLPLSASTATILDSRQIPPDIEAISSADVKQQQSDKADLILDEERAKQSIPEEHVEKIPPSQGATSLLEPDETISNPFAHDKESPRASTSVPESDAEPQRFSAADSVRDRSREPSAAAAEGAHAPDTPGMNSNHFSVVSLGSTAASVASGAVSASDAWSDGERMRATVMLAPGSDGSIGSGERTTSNYDFLLARLETQNSKLTTDPKAMRNSMDGADKLRENFEKLREQGQARHSRGESQNRLLNGLPVATATDEAAGHAGNDDEAASGDASTHWEGPPGEELEEEAINWEFWGNVMSNYQQVARTQPSQLSRAIQAGIPAALRGMTWQLMSSSKDEEMEIIYAYYLKQSSPHEKAIRRDLNRTFPEQDYFQDGKGIGQENLFNVVKAYSLYDPEVGYCQGMQFVVGPLLLNMPEEEAFSTLVRLMKSYDLRGHFTPNMPSLQLRLFQFDRLLEEFLPLLHMHLVRQGVKSSMYASQWFMTLFSYRFPLELVYRILDSVFAEGVEALFRFALALMKRNEEALLRLNFDSAVSFLKQGLFDVYLKSNGSAPASSGAEEPASGDAPATGAGGKPIYHTNEFVRDAFQIKITPFMLDSYASEFDEQVRAANAHRREVEALRLVNRNLAARVKALEDQLNSVNKEHVDLVKSVVMAKIAKEEMAEELVKYKMMYAEVVLQADQDNSNRGSMGVLNGARSSS